MALLKPPKLKYKNNTFAGYFASFSTLSFAETAKGWLPLIAGQQTVKCSMSWLCAAYIYVVCLPMVNT